MPLSGWPASCLLPAHPTGVFPIRILCSVRYVCGFCLRWHRALVLPWRGAAAVPLVAEYTLTALSLSLPDPLRGAWVTTLL